MGIILNKPKRAERASKVSRQNITSTIKDVQIRSVYKLGKIIGTGHFGVVREATATGSNEKVAIKSILKSLLNDKLNYLMQEIEILKKVDHPNIIRFYEAYEDDRYIYIVMEFCNGGDLFRKMTTLEHLDENETRSLIRQILLSVNHLHQNNIVHRDLKPENFLFETKDQATILKLVDFGLSSRFKNKSRSFHSTVGTIYYLAPEVIHGNYNYKCDLWSIGVIMYSMLSGDLPFWSKHESEIFEIITTGIYNLEDKIWQLISNDARDLLSKLLCIDPAKRISASEALNHSWFCSIEKPKIKMDSSTLKAFRDYSKISYFQKEAMSILVKHLNLDEIKELNQLFFSLDQNNVGSISMSLLARTMSSFGFNLAKKELKNLITSLDIDNDGKINYSEFLAATYYSKHHLQQEELWATFTHFDVYRKGYITSQDLEFCLSRSGHYTKEKELEGIMKDLGIDQDAKIQFDEFVKLFFPINNSST